MLKKIRRKRKRKEKKEQSQNIIKYIYMYKIDDKYQTAKIKNLE